MIWPTALIAILGLVPYSMVDPLMKLAMVVNPAEFLRIFLIIQWDSGAIFGASYDAVVHLFQSAAGWGILIGYMMAYLLIVLTPAILFLKKRRFL
ncbi:hypothetical protein FAY30_20495 [Bacillus sp. S3]|nr:hypothetical protein FAY30_20495 [Bacillus sp. S3]